MRVLQLLSLMLALLAFTSHAMVLGHGVQSIPTRPAKRSADLNIQNFQISNVYAASIPNADGSRTDSISFQFVDYNSYTGISCGISWTENGSSNNVPFSYVVCGSDATEVFEFKFTSYTSPMGFQLELAHGFSDPTDYPPPYNEVVYFSAPTTLNLQCADSSGTSGCTLPADQPIVYAVVDAISD